MHNTELLRLQTAASKNLEIFLRQFNDHYFNLIHDDSKRNNFTEDFITFHAISKEGKSFDIAIKALEAFKLNAD